MIWLDFKGIFNYQLFITIWNCQLTRIDVFEIPGQMRQLQGNVSCIRPRCRFWCRRRGGNARSQGTEESALELPAHFGDDACLPEVGRHFAEEFNCKIHKQRSPPKGYKHRCKSNGITWICRMQRCCRTGCVVSSVQHSQMHTPKYMYVAHTHTKFNQSELESSSLYRMRIPVVL